MSAEMAQKLRKISRSDAKSGRAADNRAQTGILRGKGLAGAVS
jgi:hypothetical protein